MKHRVAGRQFSRPVNQRRAFVRSLLVALLQYEKIKTTEARAKEIQPKVERIISRARVDSQANRRQVMADLNNRLITNKLFELIGPRYRDRPGGYTRIIRIGQRLGDAAEIVQIELT